MNESNAQKKCQNTIYSNTADWSYDEVPLTVYRSNNKKRRAQSSQIRSQSKNFAFKFFVLIFIQPLRVISKLLSSLLSFVPRARMAKISQDSKVLHLPTKVIAPLSFLANKYSALVLLMIMALFGGYYYWSKLEYKYRLASEPLIKKINSQPSFSSLNPLKPQLVSLTVRSKDTFASILSRFGIAASEAQEIEVLLLASGKQKEKSFKLKVGQKVEYHFSSEKTPWELIVVNNAGVQFAVKKDTAGKFQLKQVELTKVEKERIAVGIIYTSFAEAARKSGVSYDIIDDMVDLFSNRVEFNRDLQKGDRFTLILSGRELEDGTIIGGNVILAAALSINGKQIKAVRWVGSDGKPRYFDESGQLIGDFFLRYPLKFSHISSTFSYARFHPILKTFRPHRGVDFAAPTGTPVRSVADGTIRFAGYKGASGLMVEIAHGGRYSTNYLHLSRINSEIRTGARVSRGQVIGAVGNTGRSTGPHLHYGFYDSGKYVDPLKIKLPVMDDVPKGSRLDQRYMQKVTFTLDNYQTMKVDKPQWYQ
ncbi:MAG: peptidoglycan DD-metalloendopeptidase family protein [Deltaproteobacteria bacterium]|nr:peptidoglycan DD-metalloendopeptidase family protein [Deltaproteobacteria bacterium]